MAEIKKHLFNVCVVLFAIYTLIYTYTIVKKTNDYNVHLLIGAAILGAMVLTDYWLNRDEEEKIIEVPSSELPVREEYGKFQYKTTKDKLREMRHMKKLKRKYKRKFAKSHVWLFLSLGMMALGVYQRMI